MTERPAAFGPYLLLKPLGRGAMGDVYLARPQRARRGVPDLVVIKRLRQEHGRSESFVRRFAHEAEIATHVNSPNVVRMYDAGWVDDQPYLAIEYIAGWTLQRVLTELITQGRELSLDAIADIM